MLRAPQVIAADARPPGAIRREFDRQMVDLLRQLHADNKQIIALLGQMVREVGLLQLPGSGDPQPDDGETTGFWGPISGT
jgi:hypothetical protein